VKLSGIKESKIMIYLTAAKTIKLRATDESDIASNDSYKHTRSRGERYDSESVIPKVEEKVS